MKKAVELYTLAGAQIMLMMVYNNSYYTFTTNEFVDFVESEKFQSLEKTFKDKRRSEINKQQQQPKEDSDGEDEEIEAPAKDEEDDEEMSTQESGNVKTSTLK